MDRDARGELAMTDARRPAEPLSPLEAAIAFAVREAERLRREREAGRRLRLVEPGERTGRSAA